MNENLNEGRRAFDPYGFFATHELFRVEEFVTAYVAAGHSAAAAMKALEYHARRRTILSVRRGLYWVQGETFDPLLVPSRLHPSAALAYDGAAQLHALADIEHQCCFLAPYAMRRFRYSEIVFRGLADRSVGDDFFRRQDFIVDREHHGVSLRTTSFTRTVVDCLDRIDLGPDVESLFMSFLEMNDPPLDIEVLATWAGRRASPVAMARLGLLLSSHRRLRSEARLLRALQSSIQRDSTYATRDRSPGGQYAARWRLMVPPSLARHVSIE